VTGCMALMALGKEDTERQNAIVEFGAIPPLVRLLRLSKTTPLVMITCIRAIATLSLGELLPFLFCQSHAIIVFVGSPGFAR